MRRKRRTHSPEFKAKVALAAIQGEADHGRTGQEVRCTRQSDHRLEEAVAEQCPDVFPTSHTLKAKLLIIKQISRATRHYFPIVRVF